MRWQSDFLFNEQSSISFHISYRFFKSKSYMQSLIISAHYICAIIDAHSLKN